jgi:DNA repair protein RadA/Sms
MARSTTRYVCQSCGAVYSRWAGKCEACDAWNALMEEAAEQTAPVGGRARASGKAKRVEFVALDGKTEQAPRLRTEIDEFDRVTGGGLVRGSALLVGGDPGIGKSTLLLQVLTALGNKRPCAYISGEEAVDQVRLRADRLGVADAPVQLAAATNMRDILASLDAPGGPEVVVIDSIQTMYIDALESAPGTVAQVRACAQEIIRLAKRRGFTVLLVGHVTREGTIAGPKVLEHMVDTVLYFEGDRGHQFRILRAVKNRFGPGDEIGVFEMTLSANGAARCPAPRCLPVSRGRGQCWWKFKRLSPRRRWARHAAPWSDGTATGWPWFWPFLRHAADCSLGGMIYISMLLVGCGSVNRPPIWR